MADDEEATPQAGELTTANYGWIKPSVGASDDVWGGYINSDLDGIDTTVKSIDTAKLNLTGGTVTGSTAFTGGVTMGSNLAGSAISLTKHLALFGAGYGFNVTSGQLNFVASSVSQNYLTATGLQGPVGATTPNTGAFTTLSASGTVSGAGFTSLLAPYALTASVPVASSTTPAMDGAAAVGTGATWARADHVHPSDTSKYDASNPSGYQTAAQVTAALPPASTTTPLADGVAAIGTSGAFARADHVHPLPLQAIGDNRIINGDMRIDQRNNGAQVTPVAGSYPIDRWYFNASQPSKFIAGRNLSALGTLVPEFPYCLGLSSLSAYALAAGDTFYIEQPIEADMVSDFAWGKASAHAVTLSFWAFSSLTGTFGGVVQNNAATRSYPFSFSLPTANTWVNVAITIPGDTAGTWVMSGNGGAIRLRLDLGSGSTSRGPANAWASANYVGATGAVNIVSTNGAYLYLTGVKLELGSVATPFNRQSLAKSMADCQRYYQVLSAGIRLDGNYAAAGTIGTTAYFQTMRAAPTATGSYTTSTNISNGPFFAPTLNTMPISANTSGAGQVSMILSAVTLSAEL